MFKNTTKIFTAAAILAAGFISSAAAEEGNNYYVHTDENREFVLFDLSEAVAQTTQAINVKLAAQIDADIAQRTHILNERPLSFAERAEAEELTAKIDNMLAENYTQLTQTLMANVDASIPTAPAIETSPTLFADAEDKALMLASLEQ